MFVIKLNALALDSKVCKEIAGTLGNIQKTYGEIDNVYISHVINNETDDGVDPDIIVKKDVIELLYRKLNTNYTEITVD